MPDAYFLPLQIIVPSFPVKSETSGVTCHVMTSAIRFEYTMENGDLIDSMQTPRRKVGAGMEPGTSAP